MDTTTTSTNVRAATAPAHATRGFLRDEPGSDGEATSTSSASGAAAVTAGVLGGGGALLVGGLALRRAPGVVAGNIGLGMAAAGAALLGVGLLSACANAATGPGVPGDVGDVANHVSTLPETLERLPEAATDRTNPAPPGWLPTSSTTDTRAGVVQIAHDGGLGSGWVVSPGHVITNYHVAQGHPTVAVIDHAGVSHTGTVTRLDRTHDLALVAVPDLADAPLPMDDRVTRTELAEVTGYPGGHVGRSTAAAALRVDVDDDGIRRPTLMFTGKSEPGVSGGAVINGAGEVLGTAFAVGSYPDEATPLDFVLAIPNEQVRGFLAEADRAEAEAFREGAEGQVLPTRGLHDEAAHAMR